MRAMVLAAGLGTRLRPLTDDRPKALVEVGGRTMLEIALRRLCACGVREVIVNVHHYAEMVIDYLKANHDFGLRVEVSREPALLDTGGGLKQVAWFLRGENADRDEPFLLHNVDIISTIDLPRMIAFHRERRPLATLAVQARTSSRYLLFDGAGQLGGRRVGRDGEPQIVRPSWITHALAFCGVHVISPRIFDLLEEQGAFSIIDAYLRLARTETILAFRADPYYWRDLGRPESVAEAARDLERNPLTQ